jgi:hypothetical protein
MAHRDAMSADLDRLLADPDELARVIDALSWGDEAPLRTISPTGHAALKAWLTHWLLQQARVRRLTYAGPAAGLGS